MFRKKGEFLGVYDYADEVWEVYPHPIEGALIGVMKPQPTICMFVGGKWKNIVAASADIPQDLSVESLKVAADEGTQIGQGDVMLSGDLTVGNVANLNSAEISGTLNVNDDVEMNSDARVGVDLTVKGDAYFDGNVYVTIGGESKSLAELLGD